MAKKSVFISHAEKDMALASALTDLLKNSLSLKSEELFSISMEETGIPAGVDFVSHIRSRIGNPDTTIVLLSPNYLGSRFCLCEWGAVWALSKNMVPLLVPPLASRHVSKLITESRLIHINHLDELNKFASLLQEQLGLDNLNLPRWAMEKKKFLNSIEPIIKQG